uniref:TROVE domain-containing protein n=1 Tax=viral metagenome TaxID=1070528 RepID=A0A6C0JKC0_9ZZZZ
MDTYDNDVLDFYIQTTINVEVDMYSLKNKYMNLIKTKNPYVLPLLAQTRDIITGKGLCNISYLMCESLLECAFNDVIPIQMFEKVFDRFFVFEDHPYGSYKDIKYLCQYIRDYSIIKLETKTHIYEYLIFRYVKTQLSNDLHSDTPSLLAKWLPRERSKFGWLAKLIANICFSSLEEYRKAISKINIKLDTPQIHMCSGFWSDISFNKVSGTTLVKSHNAFKSTKNKDRALCAEHFNNFISQSSFKLSHIMPHQLVQQSIQKYDDTLDILWNNLIVSYPLLKPILPIVDMTSNSIGMGLLLSELSEYHKVITFSQTIELLDVKHLNFNEKVQYIREIDSTVCKNNKCMIYDFILNKIKSGAIHPDITIVILSNKISQVHLDMDHSKSLPHIIYWNVNSAQLPITHKSNITTISGNSATLVNCLFDLDQIKNKNNNITSWNILEHTLNKPRFKFC